jgi:mevalonate kinase
MAYDRNQYFDMSKNELIKERDRLNLNKEILNLNLSKMDLLVSNTYHVLEINKLNGAKMLQLASKLRKILKQRREIKDLISNSQKLLEIIGIIIKMSDDERKYSFRVGKNADFLIESSFEDLMKAVKLKDLKR